MAGKAFPTGHARDLIKRGLNNGTIKLGGAASSHDDPSAIENGKRDAAYLRALSEALTDGARD